MDYKVLYRKYRPDDFSSIVGQNYMVSILKNSIKSNKISHAYIFSGPRGTGKTSAAKVFAKAINCLNPQEFGPCNECESCRHFKENADIIEIDAASNNGVDEVREIINNIKLAPSYSKYKVYIIDEVHMLSTSAFNALLLTLEEPPKHVVFILATTNIEAVPITILSRCQRFDFHKIALQDLIDRLKYVVKEEQIQIADDALEEIAYISDGGMRDALSILDQLSSSISNITLEDVSSHFGSVSTKQINDLYNMIIENNVNVFVESMKNYKNLAIDYKLLIKKLLEKVEQESIFSKTKNDYQGLAYEKLKQLAYDLASISNYVTLNVDPYLLIEITLLNYFPGNNSSQKNISNEKTECLNILDSNQKEEKDSTLETKVEETPEIKSNEPKTVSINEELINIRINNCFVNAQKEYLQNLKQNWPSFINNISHKSLLSLLVDTQIVAASDKNAIITSELEEPVDLLNSKIDELAEEYNRKYYSSYSFVVLSKERWLKEKNIYIDNLKNKKEYKYIEENKITEQNVESTNLNDFEKTALNIFAKEKIEIE